MNKVTLHRRIQSEIETLVTQSLLTQDQAERVKERYPAGAWDFASLARWFTLFGAISTGAGVVILASQLNIARTLLEIALFTASVGLIFLAKWVLRTHSMEKTANALELLASFALQAFTIALADHYSQHSGNWPLLIATDSALVFVLAYVLRNRLILIDALINFYLFYSGETASGTQSIEFAVEHALRYLPLGLAALGVAYVHSRASNPSVRGFGRAYLHFGLVVTHLALWFLSLFGNVTESGRWFADDGERIFYSVVWAATSVGSIWASGRTGLRTLRTYGLTFLIIDGYMAYFQFVAANTLSGWWFHLLLTGGSLVFLATHVDQLKRARN